MATVENKPIIPIDLFGDRELHRLLVEILPEAYQGDALSYVDAAWVIVDGFRERRYAVCLVPELSDFESPEGE